MINYQFICNKFYKDQDLDVFESDKTAISSDTISFCLLNGDYHLPLQIDPPFFLSSLLHYFSSDHVRQVSSTFLR